MKLIGKFEIWEMIEFEVKNQFTSILYIYMRQVDNDTENHKI